MRLGYILRRLAFLVGVIWTAATLNFVLPHLAPRDPVAELISQQVAMQGLTADALATSIFILGREKGRHLARRFNSDLASIVVQ